MTLNDQLHDNGVTWLHTATAIYGWFSHDIDACIGNIKALTTSLPDGIQATLLYIYALIYYIFVYSYNGITLLHGSDH